VNDRAFSNSELDGKLAHFSIVIDEFKMKTSPLKYEPKTILEIKKGSVELKAAVVSNRVLKIAYPRITKIVNFQM